MARDYQNGDWAVDSVSDDNEDDKPEAPAVKRVLEEESDTDDSELDLPATKAPSRHQSSNATAGKTSTRRRSASSSVQQGQPSTAPQRSSGQRRPAQLVFQGRSSHNPQQDRAQARRDRIRRLRAQIAQHKADANAHRSRMQQSLNKAEGLQTKLDSLRNSDGEDSGEEDEE